MRSPLPRCWRSPPIRKRRRRWNCAPSRRPASTLRHRGLPRLGSSCGPWCLPVCFRCRSTGLCKRCSSGQWWCCSSLNEVAVSAPHSEKRWVSPSVMSPPSHVLTSIYFLHWDRPPDARKRSLAAPPPCVPYMRNPGVEEGGATSRRVPLAGTWSIAIVRGVVCQRRVGANPDSCRSIVVEPGDEHASSCSIGAVPLNRRGVS